MDLSDGGEEKGDLREGEDKSLLHLLLSPSGDKFEVHLSIYFKGGRSICPISFI